MTIGGEDAGAKAGLTGSRAGKSKEKKESRGQLGSLPSGN